MTPLQLAGVIAGAALLVLAGSWLACRVIDRLVSDDETDCSE